MTNSKSLACKNLVSVIIPVYNRPRLIVEAIDSVVCQTYRPIEIIVVNDGSTDETRVVLESLQESLQTSLKVIHVVNGGVGQAREHGRQAATGEFIQYLDSDDLLLPGKFKSQVAALEANADCGIAYGKTRLVSDDGTVIAAPFKRSGERFDYLFPLLLVDRWWNTLTPLYRRSVCDAIGPWSDMRMSEDWEYEARAAGLGVKLAFCDEFVADVREHNHGRLTGGGTPSTQVLKDTYRLLKCLLANARKASVPHGAPEWRHFSRWAFSVSRQFAVAGHAQEAKDCLEMSIQALPDGAQALDIRLFRSVAGLIGWQTTAQLGHLMTRLLQKRPGPATLKQSWMQ
jgi:cellulose synthase/poly-beta-1,6-N-acetylglucosamine synthase-like glycosyltransferase